MDSLSLFRIEQEQEHEGGRGGVLAIPYLQFQLHVDLLSSKLVGEKKFKLKKHRKGFGSGLRPNNKPDPGPCTSIEEKCYHRITFFCTPPPLPNTIRVKLPCLVRSVGIVIKLLLLKPSK